MNTKDPIIASKAALMAHRYRKLQRLVIKPTAAPKHFPYDHQTCAEWIDG